MHADISLNLDLVNLLAMRNVNYKHRNLPEAGALPEVFDETGHL